MKTYRQLAMGLLALMICITLPSCSDDDENDNQTNELTLNWEIEVSDDLLNVANIAYTLYEGQEEMPEPELIVSNGTGSKITGKAPLHAGCHFQPCPKGRARHAEGELRPHPLGQGIADQRKGASLGQQLQSGQKVERCTG